MNAREEVSTSPAVARKLSIGRAMNEAIAQAMQRDERVFIMGEDICRFEVFGDTPPDSSRNSARSA